ncbi:MAG: CHRD domain-containing protein [Candidatus Hydrogenedens sp.]|nr:CHRD domain-containing protein [Candidatus Hydrogenedens sp.]
MRMRAAITGSAMAVLVALGSAWAGEGSAGDGVCDPPLVPVRGKFSIKHTDAMGRSASDFHFYLYQNDRPSVQVLGANAGSDAFDNVDAELDSDNGAGTPSGQGAPFHGAQIDMSGGSVANGERITVDVQLCMNERNCLKLKDIEWTYDDDPGMVPKPGGGGWRVGGPNPGGNGGNGNPGGGGQGAQEGDGGGDGNHFHTFCIENDDPALCLYVSEVKLLASDTRYDDIEDDIDWDAIFPIVDENGEPPVVIQPGGKWCYNLDTDGAFIGGHVYSRYAWQYAPCPGTKGGGEVNPDDDDISIGDHPVEEPEIDSDLDGLPDVYEEIYDCLDPDDDGTTDIDAGPLGDPDHDGVLTIDELDRATDPCDGASPPTIPPGIDTFSVDGFFDVTVPIPENFFYPGCLPFEAEIKLSGAPLNDSLVCPGPLGSADTVIERLGPLVIPEPGAIDSVPVELRELNLVGIDPITVSDGETTTTWDVYARPSQEAPAPQGTAGAQRLSGGNGQFQVTLPVPIIEIQLVNQLNPLDTLLLQPSPPVGLFINAIGPFSDRDTGLACPDCDDPFAPGLLTDGGNEVVFVPACTPYEPMSGDILPGASLFQAGEGSYITPGLGLPPIPGDLFGLTAPPFEGRIDLQAGLPVASSACPDNIASGILERPGPARFSDGRTDDRIDLEMNQLSLQSVAPVFHVDSFFDVTVEISFLAPSSGSLDLHNAGGGGTADLRLAAGLKLTFQDTGTPGNTFTVDMIELGGFLPLSAEGIPWSQFPPPNDASAACSPGFSFSPPPSSKMLAPPLPTLALSGPGAAIILEPAILGMEGEGMPGGEGAIEGGGEGIPKEGEGSVEGTPEGVADGEGTLEGTPEGVSDGEGAQDGEGAPDILCTIALNEANEVSPPNPATGATGTATFTRLPGGIVRLEVVHNVANVTASHIHSGAPGVNGPVVQNLGSPASPIIFDLSEADYEVYRTGHYINVHSSANLGGEIRGDIDCPPLPFEGEGQAEGVTDGEGHVEGAPGGEGQPEGVEDGEGGPVEGSADGEGGGEGSSDETRAKQALVGFRSADTSDDGVLSFSEASSALGFTQGEFNALDTNGDGELTTAELQAKAGADAPIHNADQNANGVISLSELLRLIQFYNASGYRCAPNQESEDGFFPGAVSVKALDPACPPNASDYDPADGVIALSELLRLIQFYNLGSIVYCPGQSEDQFCPAP